MPRVREVAPQLFLHLTFFATVAFGWQALARALDSLLLPTFTDTLRALADLAGSRALWDALWVSNQAVLLGFALAAAVGITLGVLVGRWRQVEPYVDPYLSILLATPKSALIPIIIMATGLGLLSRVLVIFSYSVVMITLNVRAGLRTIEQSWIDMAQSYGATEPQLWRRILLPGSLPAVLTGLRLGLARSVSGMITMELTLIALGVGRLILDYQGTFQSAKLFATVLVVVAEAVLLLRVAAWLERGLTPWHTTGERT